jgi:hypothetical protein
MNMGRNLGAAPAAASSFGGPSSNRAASNVVAAAGGFLSGWGGVLVILVALLIVFAVYYQTIGYYFQIGWDKLRGSRRHGERIEIQIPGGPSAVLQPAGGPDAELGSGSSIASELGKAVSALESDVEAALGEGNAPGGKQVFNVARNVYTFEEAEPLCRAFGAELATYDQVKDAYKAGADWCNYGWVKGQLAVYPTQKSTYEKLQHGPESERESCGVPGVNGGYFPNAEQRFGVNCYGARPAESALDERIQMEEHSDFAYDREVARFRAERDSTPINPWNRKQWTA